MVTPDDGSLRMSKLLSYYYYYYYYYEDITYYILTAGGGGGHFSRGPGFQGMGCGGRFQGADFLKGQISRMQILGTLFQWRVRVGAGRHIS